MYYPKSQIKTSLYTNGNELATSTNNEPYSGYYYEISTGTKYTGKNPQDGLNIVLIPIKVPLNPSEPPKQADINFGDDIILYSTDPLYPQNQFIERTIPKFNPTTPTTQDQQQGQFTRYFCKKTNEPKYMEIDFDTYNKLISQDPKIAWDLYNPTQIIWLIQGNREQVYNSNKGSVQSIEQNLLWYGFSQYFKNDFSKYYLGS
jgi:hypothetical protein